MFKKETSFKLKADPIAELKKSTLIPAPNYRQTRCEILRAKRCHSNNSIRNQSRVINVIDNIVNKLNVRRKTPLIPSNSYSSDSQSSSICSLTVSDSSEDSAKTNSNSRLNEIKTKFKDSPKLILRSTQNYIRSLKRPNEKIQNLKSLDFARFESNHLKDLEESSILKSLLDSQQYTMIKNRLSQASIKYNKHDEISFSSDNSNNSCIVHDYSDESDCVSNQTFVEHSDDSCLIENDSPLEKELPNDCKDSKKYFIDQMNLTTHWDKPKIVSNCKNENVHKSEIEPKPKKCEEFKNPKLPIKNNISSHNTLINKVQIPDWLIELSNFSEDNIQWDSLDLKSLELYEMMLQRIHKYELMELIEKHEKYRARLNEMLEKF